MGSDRAGNPFLFSAGDLRWILAIALDVIPPAGPSKRATSRRFDGLYRIRMPYVSRRVVLFGIGSSPNSCLRCYRGSVAAATAGLALAAAVKPLWRLRLPPATVLVKAVDVVAAGVVEGAAANAAAVDAACVVYRRCDVAVAGTVLIRACVSRRVRVASSLSRWVHGYPPPCAAQRMRCAAMRQRGGGGWVAKF